MNVPDPDWIGVIAMHGLTIDQLKRLKKPLLIQSRGVPLVVVVPYQQYLESVKDES